MERVLVVEPAGQLWGSERALLANLAHRPTGRVEVAVCLPSKTPLEPHLHALSVQTFPTFVANLHLKSKLARARALAGLLAAAVRFSPDVIHVNQTGAARIALVAGRLLGVPVTTHVQLAEDVAYLEGLGQWLAGLRAAVCVSASIQSQFAPDGPLQPDRLISFYLPVDQAGAVPAQPPAHPLRVSCVGRLVRTKGQDVLVGALAVLHARGAGLDAIVIGSTTDGSSFDADLREQARRLGVEDRIRWVGFDPHPERLAAGAVAAVCPSYHESFGLVIVEAWAAGTVPVVWRGSGGAAEIVAVSGGGLFYDEQTPESLADALARAVALAPDERACLVAAGQRWVRTACDPSTQAARLTDVWSRAAEFHVGAPF